jgi:hypothetical protein
MNRRKAGGRMQSERRPFGRATRMRIRANAKATVQLTARELVNLIDALERETRGRFQNEKILNLRNRLGARFEEHPPALHAKA